MRQASWLAWFLPTLTATLLAAYGCSSLKTYYYEYTPEGAPPSVAPRATAKPLPPAETERRAAEKSPAATDNVSSAATSAEERSHAAAQATADSNPVPPATAEASLVASHTGASATPSAQPSPAALMLSSSADADGQQRQHAADMIQRVDRTLQKIDRKALTPDGQSRVALADEFLKSARNAFAENSYGEATSLTDKAAMMIAPVVTTPAP